VFCWAEACASAELICVYVGVKKLVGVEALGLENDWCWVWESFRQVGTAIDRLIMPGTILRAAAT
jgi:hypothetical protein